MPHGMEPGAIPQEVLPTQAPDDEALSEILTMLRAGQVGSDRFLQLLSLLAASTSGQGGPGGPQDPRAAQAQPQGPQAQGQAQRPIQAALGG